MSAPLSRVVPLPTCSRNSHIKQRSAPAASSSAAAGRPSSASQALHLPARLRGGFGRGSSSLTLRAASKESANGPSADASERKRKMSAKEIVEEASGILNTIIKEYSNEVLADEGSSEATGEALSQDKQSVLRTTVARYVDKIDDQFLAVLSSYIAYAAKTESHEMVRILMGIREEVLNAVGGLLPPEIQLVDLLTTLTRESDVDRVIAIAHSGGGTFGSALRIPACPAEKVFGAASRIIEQMEDKDQELVDWRLLALVCTSRERARRLMRPDGKAPECHVFASGSFPAGSLPVPEAALMKELLRVGDPLLRRGMLGKAMEDARAQVANAVEPGTTGGGLSEERTTRVVDMSASKPSPGVRKKAPVRPGRLLDCFWNARAGVMRADDQTDPSRMKSDVIYLRLSEMLDSTVSILRETAKA